MLLFFFTVASCLASTLIDPTAQYIELSMDLTAKFKELPEFNEQEIHDLAKRCVDYGENQKQLTKAYETYLNNKSAEYQRQFTEKFILPRHMAVVSERLQKLPGFYLTKTQIEKFRHVVLTRKLEGSPVENTITELKNQLSKEIGEEKANRAIDMLVKDLKMIYKVHGKMVHQVDPALAYLIHDEL